MLKKHKLIILLYLLVCLPVIDVLSKREANFNSKNYRVKNLWDKSITSTDKTLQKTIDAHDTLILRLTLIK
jgi:hypothetical protein